MSSYTAGLEAETAAAVLLYLIYFGVIFILYSEYHKSFEVNTF